MAPAALPSPPSEATVVHPKMLITSLEPGTEHCRVVDCPMHAVKELKVTYYHLILTMTICPVHILDGIAVLNAGLALDPENPHPNQPLPEWEVIVTN